MWVCAWIYLWVLANFVGIVEKFCWVCENSFVHEVVGIFLRHVEIFFLHGYGKIWWLYGYVINLVVVTFWWGIDLIFWWGIDCGNIFLGMEIFWLYIFGYGNV